MYEILFASSRSAYVGKHKPIQGCLLCAIRDKDPNVWTRLIYQNESVIILMNIFPYSPGHVQVVPSKHISDLSELSESELTYTLEFVQRCVVFIKKLMRPSGFNIGLNLGRKAGASIEHIHFQIVPRYNANPKMTAQEDIHKLYLENADLLTEKISLSKKKSRCRCAKPKYILKDNPLIYLSEKPYNRGHIIISPESHISEVENLSSEEFHVLVKECINARKIIERIYSPVGFNLGINTGALPNSSDHLQLHLVPRFDPESGFMEVIADTRVIIETLEQSYEKLKSFF